MKDTSFGAFIKKYRTDRGIKGTFIADKAGISRQCFQQMEKEGRSTGIKNAMKILKVLGLTLTDYENYLKTLGE